MRQLLLILFGLVILCVVNASIGAAYSKRYCDETWVDCIKIQRGQSWQKLWPDPAERDLVQRLNRTNMRLQPGMTIAVPKNLSVNVNSISPLRQQIRPFETPTIVVSLNKLAWAAYSSDGQLQKWGPVSGGRNYCPDIESSCRTKTGVYYIYYKRGAECVSTKFPIEEGGGAPMPYCMFYYGGYALHGSPQVPGYHASHGCIRLFTEDAQWLNQEFTDGVRTRVIVLPYDEGVDSEENL